MSYEVILGDCLEVEIPRADLIYMDPPFNKGRRMNQGSNSYSDIFDIAVEINGHGSAELTSFLNYLTGSRRNYAQYMVDRLLKLKDSMAENSSLFYHCDHTSNSDVRELLNIVFGAEGFRNEIAWCYDHIGRTPKKVLPRKHDTIFYYVKGSPALNTTFYDHPKSGELAKCIDWWADIKSFNGYMRPAGDKHTGYPTQKPLKLLGRLILMASNEGDVVVDPFCGSGTTLVAARVLGRSSVGVDMNVQAVDIATRRLASEEHDQVRKTIISTVERTCIKTIKRKKE